MGFVEGFCIEGRSRRVARMIFVLAVAGVATLLALPGVAAAQTADDPSAVDQYVEDVPTGGGSSVPGSGGKPKQNDLPKNVQNDIASQGGDDAPLLNQVASSSDYGAPQKTIKRKREKSAAATISGSAMERREGDGSSASPEGDVSAASAVSSAISADGGGSDRLVVLLVVLFLISLGAFAVSVLRLRRRDT